MDIKKAIFLLLTTFCCISITSCSNEIESQQNSSYEEEEIIIETEHAEIYIEKNYLTEEEISEIKEKIANGIVEIENYLTETYVKRDISTSKIKYYIKKGKFMSNVKDGVVNLSYVKEKNSPYVHETVHILASYNEQKVWISEGLAVYLNDKYNYYSAFPNFGENLDEISHKIIKDEILKNVLSFHNDYANPNIVSKEERQAYYIVSGSLVSYIENMYGKEKLMEIYNNVNIENVLNKSFVEIKNEWIKYIENLN